MSKFQDLITQIELFIKKYYNTLKEEHKKPIEFINSIKDSSEKIKNYEYFQTVFECYQKSSR